MNQKINAPSEEFLTLLCNQYRAGCGMLSQTNSRRTATARFFISVATGLIGLLTIILRQNTETEAMAMAINIIAVLALILNVVWYSTIKSLRHLTTIQRNLLKEMEEMLPHAFITRQEQMMQRSAGWLNPDNLEQFLPLGMAIPSVLILVLTYLG